MPPRPPSSPQGTRASGGSAGGPRAGGTAFLARLARPPLLRLALPPLVRLVFPHYRPLVLLLLPLLLPFLAGCASVFGRRPPPPAAAELQDAGSWVRRLGEAPRPGMLQADLTLTISARGRRPVAVDGSLAARLPDTLVVRASIGSFKPLFAFWADADSCILLLHDEARDWIVPRNLPDWDALNPAALALALRWVLDPPSLARELVPEGPARWEDDLVWVRGRLAGGAEADLKIDLGLTPRSARLTRLRVLRRGDELLRGSLARFRSVAGGDLATSFTLDLPDWGFRGELQNSRSTRRVKLPPAKDRRPPGWRPVDPSFVLTPAEMGSR